MIFHGGPDNESKTYRLPGDNLNNVYKGKQLAQECTYYSLSWIDHYLKNIKGLGGTPRTPDHFRKYNHMKRGANPREIFRLVAGNFSEWARITGGVEEMVERVRSGSPVLLIESGDDPYHAVVLVELTVNGSNPDNVDAKVYNPMSGLIEQRTNYFSTSGFPFFLNDYQAYSIIKP